MSLQVAHKMQILFVHDICLLSKQKALLIRNTWDGKTAGGLTLLLATYTFNINAIFSKISLG